MLWTTELPGILGDRFVTVTCDDTRVYAFTRGQMHCLDLNTGRLLWSNELKGFGYGIATLCIPGTTNDAAPAVQTKIASERRG